MHGGKFAGRETESVTDEELRLLEQLIRCRSVTPEDAGCQDILAGLLEPLGFTCEGCHTLDPAAGLFGTDTAQNFEGEFQLDFQGEHDADAMDALKALGYAE